MIERMEHQRISDHVTRLILDSEPFAGRRRTAGLFDRYQWPARWIAPPGTPAAPIVWAARCRFAVGQRHAPIRIHVSADERFELYLDGELFARGPERGDGLNWHFHTYELADLPAGAHLLSARIWALGDEAPHAQVSFGTAFLVAAEADWDELLTTGTAPWEVRLIEGIGTRCNGDVGTDGITGMKLRLDASRYPFGVEYDAEDGPEWTAARTLHPAVATVPAGRQTLRAAILPDMLRIPVQSMRVRFAERLKRDTDLARHRCLERNGDAALVSAAQAWVAGEKAWRIEPNTRLRVIIDLEEYCCAYPRLVVSEGSGGRILLGWAEALYSDLARHEKGNRDAIEGKCFRGYSDEFLPDGGSRRALGTLWWQAGRYLQLVVETSESPLVLEQLALEETRYPLPEPQLPKATDETMAAVFKLARRSIECCLHETFVDCPFYEQLQYIGDTRLEALVVMMCWDDARPVRKAIELFDASRLPGGWTQSRYPGRVTQVIPPFSLIWIGMVHDFLRLRRQHAFVAQRMAGVRAVIDAALGYVNRVSGLLENPPGWNFMDWAGNLADPPCPAGPVNWLFVSALRWWMELEEQVGEPEMAARARRWFETTLRAVDRAFWHEPRGAWADDLAHGQFSEHAQALAILSTAGTEDSALLERRRRALELLRRPQEGVTRATIYFTHYVLEALAEMKDQAAFDRRLDVWRALPATGLRTLPEQPEPTRSDCHAWGAHILYHLKMREQGGAGM